MKSCLTLILMLFLFSIVHAQNVPQLWVEGTADIDTLENEGFETGLGNFVNAGTVNWSTITAEAFSGTSSATSNVVFGGQDAILSLTVFVPSGFTAVLQYAVQVFITPGGDGKDDARAAFEIDGSAQFSLRDSVLWKQKTYFLTSGSHTLEWTAFHTDNASDDQVQLFLDDVVISYNSMPVLRLVDGTEGMGKVLVSDEYGNAGWVSLSAITEFANAGGNGLLPLVLNGNHQITDALTVLDANGIGIQSNSNSNNGIQAENNGADGIESNNNGSDGFEANNNDFDGFRSVNNSNHGFSAISNGVDGFRAVTNTGDGFEANSNGFDGFRSVNNGDDGFQATGNADNGYDAFQNTDNGFESNDNGENGFEANNNVLGFLSFNNQFTGFVAEENGSSGFYSIDNQLDGFSCQGNNENGFSAINNGHDGIFSFGNSGDEGYFNGTVEVTGNLSKGGGSFKIDHPLDPENKFLYHSFVESPDMMNVYNGNVVLDQNGAAIVEMQAWFEPLNRDFRYQLTAIGAPGPNLYIAEKMQNNRFKIAGGAPGSEVSWQVTGIRQDPYANQHRIEVEVEKPEKFKGYYLHHEAYDQPFKKGFSYVKLGYKTLEELQAENDAEVREREEKEAARAEKQALDKANR